MESAFAWINNIMQWFGQLIPRIIIVRTTHGGVKFVRGNRIVKLNPGISMYWPLVTEIEVIVTARRTINFHTQTLVTKDKQSIAVEVMVVYTISDVVKALTENYDLEETLTDVAMSSVVKVIQSMTMDELISEISDSVEEKLTTEVQEKLRPFGADVQRCSLTDLSPCLVLRHFGGRP